VAPSAQTDLWQIDSESDAQAFIGASLGKPDVRTCLRGRLAFVAGKRLGSAPERNRAKRLMREAAHQLKAPWDDRDVVFVARDKTVTATLDAVVRDMECLLRRMNSKKG
jgi:ribonuclease P protein component